MRSNGVIAGEGRSLLLQRVKQPGVALGRR